MCGRYGRRTEARLFARLLNATISPRLSDSARYNIAPGTFQAIALRSPDTGDITLGPGFWRFIPAKAEHDRSLPINVRTETAAQKPVFSKAFAHQRCLVAADWWYEWQGPKGAKQPYAIRPRDARPFLFAGLWSKASALSTDHVACGQVTFAILTGPPNAEIAAIHDRQPQALTPEAARHWLSRETDPARLHAILENGRHAQYEFWAVSKAVGNVAHDSPDLVTALTG